MRSKAKQGTAASHAVLNASCFDCSEHVILAVRSGSAEVTDAIRGPDATLAAGSQEPLFTPTQLEMSEGDLDFITPRTPIGVRGERHHIEFGLKSS